jgi:hypothetical protein
MAVIIEDGQHLLNETEDVRKTVEWMLCKLVETSVKRRNITAAMAAAILEQPLTYPEVDYDKGELPEDFGVAVLIAALSDLIEMGQEGGNLNSEVDAFRVANYHVVAILLMIALNPELSTEEAQRLACSQVMSALDKPS